METKNVKIRLRDFHTVVCEASGIHKNAKEEDDFQTQFMILDSPINMQHCNCV